MWTLKLTWYIAEDLLAEMLGDQHITSKAKRRRRDGQTTPTLEVSRLGDDDIDKIQSNGPSIPGRKNVDDLLPIGVSHTSDNSQLGAWIS